MFRFSSFFIFCVVFLIIAVSIFGLIKSRELEKTINPLAIIKDAFQNILNKNFPSQAGIGISLIEEEAPEEDKEESLTEEKNEEEIMLANPLAEIIEEIDEISERIDLLSQDVEGFLHEKRVNIAEFPEEQVIEKVEETEEAEEEIEEEEETEEKKGEKEHTEKEETLLCQKENEDSVRNKVIFNEMAWMGTVNSSSDEWIELKNISGSEVNLANWQILDKEDQIKVIFMDEDQISINGFYSLERTNDDSVPNTPADKIYSGGLNDTDEILYLFDENCQLQDIVLANPDWPAGNKDEKKSMERNQDFSWHTYSGAGENGIFGTPKQENSSSIIFSGGGGESATLPPSKILITEIQLLPIEQRFIELYNPNDNEIDLTNWYIQRKTKAGTSWASLVSSTQFEGKIIQPNDCFLIGRSSIFNPDILLGDLTLTTDNVILLKNPNREIIDKVGWGESQDFETAPAENPLEGKSLGRKWLEENQEYQDTDNNQEDFEVQEPTPKARNQSPIPLSVLQDTTPPQVVFDSIPYLQTNLYFSLSWSGEDFATGTTTPSGIDGFYLQYTVTPSDIDGISLRYQNEESNWQNWSVREILELEEEIYAINLSGENEKIYSFQIQAIDGARNESAWEEIVIEVNMSQEEQ